MKPQIIESNFEETAARMIAQKKHADYMKRILDEYRVYIQFMSGAFLEKPNNQVFDIRANYRRHKKL
ncbi:MAG: hypothetical protein ABIB04_05225 [Patescibacteria group bacterium]